MAIRLVIADDHNVVREALRMFLTADGEFEVVGEARNGHEAVALAKQHRPDVVLMDLMMPLMDGVAATAEIRTAAPGVEVLALTSVIEDGSVLSAIRAGAIGYLLKDADGPELKDAVRAAAAGQVRFSPAAAARLVAGVRSPAELPALSERETEVLVLIARGFANKQIGQELQIGERTVKFHVAKVLEKLGVESRTQAALQAVRAGLVPS